MAVVIQVAVFLWWVVVMVNRCGDCSGGDNYNRRGERHFKLTVKFCGEGILITVIAKVVVMTLMTVVVVKLSLWFPS